MHFSQTYFELNISNRYFSNFFKCSMTYCDLIWPQGAYENMIFVISRSRLSNCAIQKGSTISLKISVGGGSNALVRVWNKFFWFSSPTRRAFQFDIFKNRFWAKLQPLFFQISIPLFFPNFSSPISFWFFFQLSLLEKYQTFK